MTTLGIKSFKAAIAIAFLVMVLIVASTIAMKESRSSSSKTDSRLYRPFIVFAPGFAVLFELGY